MVWMWLIPVAAAASFLRPRRDPNSLSKNGTTPAVIQSTDPYNPSLDDHRGLPMERAPKTYRGKIVYTKPPTIPGPPPDYGRQFVNVAVIPGSRAVNRMILNQQAYRMSYRGTTRNWDPPAPQNYRKTVIRTDVANLSSDDAGAAASSSARTLDSTQLIKRISKRTGPSRY